MNGFPGSDLPATTGPAPVRRGDRCLLRIRHNPLDRLLPEYISLVLKVAADGAARRLQKKARD